MNSMLHIRKNVLGLSQAEMSDIAQVSQGTVSKWENGELKPDIDQLGRIRAEIRRRRIKWDDRQFFEPAPGAAA